MRQLFQAQVQSLADSDLETLLASPRWVETLHEALETLPFSLAISDARHSLATGTRSDWPLGYVNPGFVRLTGYTSEEVIGRSAKCLRCAQSEDKPLIVISEALHRREPCKVGVTNQTKTGDVFVNFLSLRPALDRQHSGGGCSLVLGIQYDVDRESASLEDLAIIDDVLLVYSQALC